jgi:hypothetical protein
MGSELTDHHVVLRFEFAEDYEREALEERAVLVLEVVEEHASHIALGPVVSGRFTPPVIELDFDVQAGSRSELFRRVSDLVAVIEHRCPLECVVRASMAEREPVPA